MLNKLANNTLKFAVYSLLPGRGSCQSFQEGGGLVLYLDWFGGGAAHAYCSVLFQSSTSFITSVMTFFFPYIHKIAKEAKEEFFLPVTIPPSDL